MIGEIEKASRTFEPERLCLRHVDLFTNLVKDYKVPVSNIFFDIKAGTYVKIFDLDKVKEAKAKKDEENASISSQSESQV
jgi:hypothetical protein